MHVHIDRPEELLTHELGEEMVSQVVDEATGQRREVVVFRGLRMKV